MRLVVSAVLCFGTQVCPILTQWWPSSPREGVVSRSHRKTTLTVQREGTVRHFSSAMLHVSTSGICNRASFGRVRRRGVWTLLPRPITRTSDEIPRDQFCRQSAPFQKRGAALITESTTEISSPQILPPTVSQRSWQESRLAPSYIDSKLQR